MTILLFALTAWSFWPEIQDVAERVRIDPQYSHCALVPVVVLFVMWSRRHLAPANRTGAWSGLLLVAAGLALNWFGGIAFFGFLQASAIVVVLMGIVATLNGWRTFAWSFPALALMIFAIPAPYRVHSALAEPLQKIVAKGSMVLLQSLGRPALASGQLVTIGDHRASVVDDCCGLGMLFVFVFLAAAIVALSRRPPIDKLLILAAAPAVGVLANVLRVAATLEVRARGFDAETAKWVHDVGGYALGPIALLIMLVLLTVVAWVFPTAKPADDPLGIAFQVGLAEQQDHPHVVRRRR